jgi:hypothetical protein
MVFSTSIGNIFSRTEIGKPLVRPVRLEQV